MKYGVYVKRGAKVDTRMLAFYREDGYDGFELVATTKTKDQAREIFNSLKGNFWN